MFQTTSQMMFQTKLLYIYIYPPVNIQKTMENHHFEWENSL